MRLGVRVALLAFVPWGACGGADIADGTVRCGLGGECPPGFRCQPDRLCYRGPVADGGDASPSDAAGCEAAPEGTPCAEDACEEWSACGDFADACATAGRKTRACRHQRCQAGACAPAEAFTEELDCVRVTDGDPCAATTCGPWDHEDFDCAGCADSRSCSDWKCLSDACSEVIRVETGTCTGQETCGLHTCSCGTFDRVCDPSGACVPQESCVTICG